MPIYLSVFCVCDTCGGPVGDTKQTGEYKGEDPLIDISLKVEKTLRKIEKKNKAKIAKSSGRVICQTCSPLANKSPKWSKG